MTQNDKPEPMSLHVNDLSYKNLLVVLEIKFTIEKCASLMNLHNLDHVRHRHTYGVIYYTNRNLALHHSAASDDK